MNFKHLTTEPPRSFPFHKNLAISFGVLLLSLTAPAILPKSVLAQDTQTSSTSRRLETIYIIGSGENRATKASGSAHVINEAVLERFEYDDIQRVLQQVPGVYIRDEDGFGLRPNIGIRGANSERSGKVVLLEDGVLLGPAPYSAPAAYFVPLATRMVGIEVFKGPAAIRTGPYTVGGAINYITSETPDNGYEGMIDLAVGNFGYVKTHGRMGVGNEYLGLLLEGARLTSSGFKELDGGGDTGFEKNEVMAKFRANTNPANYIFHRIDLKFGWADELSNESYLGLSDEDFEQNPYRRYRASQLANMDWERFQIEGSYGIWIGKYLEARLTAYQHNFGRAWFKFNRFADNTSASEVLRSENRDLSGGGSRVRVTQFEILRGNASSSALNGNSGLLRIGTNDRSFVSQGLQLDGILSLSHSEQFEQSIRFGTRLHYDEIERNHTEDTYEMEVRGEDLDNPPLGSLVRTTDPRISTLSNKESALAFSAYIEDTVTLFDQLTVTPGLRLEVISSESQTFSISQDTSDAPRLDSEQTVWIPGLGVQYQFTPTFSALAGVHRGFSPVAPGEPESIEPELSTNYEAGARYIHNSSLIEAIGYFNNYENLLVNCTFSAGCNNDDVGSQINAGAIYIYGLEVSARHRISLPAYLNLELRGQYTLTLSEFQDAITGSQQPQFEDVEVGDRLPYVPEHQTNLSAVLSAPIGDLVASIGVSYTFVDQMRNRASSGEAGENNLTEEDFTDPQHIMDLSMQLDTSEQSRMYVRIDNVLDQANLVSRRPFGARAGRPLTIQLGYTHRFGAQ